MPNSSGWLRVDSGTFTWDRGSTRQCPLPTSLPVSMKNVILVQHFTVSSSSAQNHKMSDLRHVHITDGKGELKKLNSLPRVTQGKSGATGTLINSSFQHTAQGWGGVGEWSKQDIYHCSFFFH